MSEKFDFFTKCRIIGSIRNLAKRNGGYKLNIYLESGIERTHKALLIVYL